VGGVEGRQAMNAVQHPRRNFWLLLKLLCKAGKAEKPVNVNNGRKKPRHRSHRTTAFFDMP
jgi:hypothetical protein